MKTVPLLLNLEPSTSHAQSRKASAYVLKDVCLFCYNAYDANKIRVQKVKIYIVPSRETLPKMKKVNLKKLAVVVPEQQ